MLQLKLRNRAEEEYYIEFIQENSIEFLVQSIYLIYTRPIVYAQLYLTHPKGYALYVMILDPWSWIKEQLLY